MAAGSSMSMGTEYIDYVLSWGPLILGHAHPEVVEATTKALAARDELRCSDRGGNRTGSPDRRRRAGSRSCPAGVVRHRGDDERAASGPGGDGPQQDRQVRRLLPRACRHAAGAGRERCRHPGPARQPGSAAWAPRRTPWSRRSTIWRRSKSLFADGRRRYRGGHRGAGCREHGSGSA